jgi:tetratricopeptide (TPR) repeat protein
VSRGYAIADFRDAVDRFTRAVELDPRFALAWAGLAMAHTELYWFQGDRTPRRLELAQAAIDRATALAPEDPEVVFVRGLYRYHGFLDYEAALAELRRAATVDPGRAEPYEWMGYVQRRSGRLPDAITSLERAVELDPQSARLLGGLGETYAGAGRYADGERLAERAMDARPTDWGAHNVLITAAVASGDAAEAGRRAGDALARITVEGVLVDRPDRLRDWFPMMTPATRRGLDPFPPLTAAMGDTAGYYLARAQTRSLLGRDARADFDTAATWYERRRAATPDDPWVAQAAGMAFAGQGRRDEAIRTGEAAVALFANDTWEGPAAHAILAEILWQFGDRDRAAAELERFAASYPQNRDLVRHDPRWAAMREHPRIKQVLR